MRSIVRKTVLWICAISFLSLSFIPLAYCTADHPKSRTYNQIRPEVPLNYSDPIVQAAWKLARKLGEAPLTWRDSFPAVTVIRRVILEPGGRILGRHLSYFDVKKNGVIIPVEQILIYLLPHEDANIPAVLTHEFLHSIWLRRSLSDHSFYVKNPDSEAWVCLVGGCPDIPVTVP